jgi:hypothetical protein
MRDHVSGGRWDGRDWPLANGEIEVPEWEARDLIAGGLAVPASGGAGDSAVPAPQGEVPAHPEPGAGASAAAEPEPAPSQLPGTPPEPDPVLPPEVSPVAGVSPVAEAAAIAEATQMPEPDPPPEEVPASPPAPNDVKQHWIDYAVTQGENPDTAMAMTKADLMSKYGGRL